MRGLPWKPLGREIEEERKEVMMELPGQEEPVNEDETIETLKVVEVEKVQEKLLFDESTGDKDENVGKGEPSHEEIDLKEECDEADLAETDVDNTQEEGLNKVEIETSGDAGMLPPSIYQV